MEVSKVTINNITTLRLARRLSNGHTLFTGDINNDLKFYVFEVDATGAIVWQQSLYGGRGYVAYRLDNGDTRATMVLSAPCGSQVRMTTRCFSSALRAASSSIGAAWPITRMRG
jgi:hypothetical protein